MLSSTPENARISRFLTWKCSHDTFFDVITIYGDSLTVLPIVFLYCIIVFYCKYCIYVWSEVSVCWVHINHAFQKLQWIQMPIQGDASANVKKGVTTASKWVTSHGAHARQNATCKTSGSKRSAYMCISLLLGCLRNFANKRTKRDEVLAASILKGTEIQHNVRAIVCWKKVTIMICGRDLLYPRMLWFEEIIWARGHHLFCSLEMVYVKFTNCLRKFANRAKNGQKTPFWETW